MLTCTQSGRASGLGQETDPASSARSNKKGLKETTIDCRVSLTNFISLLVQKSRYQSVGGLDSNCAEMNLHRVANFQFKHLNSDFEQIRRGIILLVLLFIQPILILLYRFSVKNTVSRLVFRVKLVIF